MLGRFINKIWPLKHFLNYIFKKTLGDYITNDLDLNKIEIEIQKNTFISLTNIELNAYEINKKHFHNSPLKMLSGKINKIDLIISTDKIEFNVNDIFILLMPVFNDEKFVNQIQNVKKKGIIENDNNVENSLISGFLNSALSNLEVSVTNICLKVLSYEVFNNTQDNPTFSIFISKIDYKKKSNEDITNVIDNDKIFFHNKVINIDKVCVKIDKNPKNEDVDNFFQLCSIDDEKIIFNFFCDNSTIFTIMFDDNSSILIDISENGIESIKLNIILRRTEIILNPLQLQLILNFIQVCSKIFRNEEKESNQKKLIKPIKILNSRIVNIDIAVSLEMFNIILLENNYHYEFPKLWSFYENNYSKSLKSIESLETHFSYFEDNFFLINISSLSLSICDNKITCISTISSEFESVHLKYVEYKNKAQRSNKANLKFNNSKLCTSKMSSIYQTILSNNSMNHSLYQSIINQSVNNAIFESAMESDMLLIYKFNKFLEYDYFYYSHSLIVINSSFQSEKTGFKLRIVFNNTHNHDNISYSKINIGDINMNFNPLYLFKFNSLIYDNILLMNEILFYLRNDKQDENTSNSEEYDKVYKTNIKNNQNSCIYYMIDINEFNISVCQIKEYNNKHVNEFFVEYYKNYIEPFLIKINSKRININQIMSIEKYLSSNTFTFKILESKTIIKSNTNMDTLNMHFNSDFNDLLIYYNSELLINYKSNSQLKKPKEFITGKSISLKKELTSIEISQQAFKELEMIYKSIDTKLKVWFLSIKLKETNLNNFNFYKQVKKYYNNCYLIHNIPSQCNIEYDSSNYEKFKRLKCNISMHYKANITIEYKNIEKLIIFTDILQYSLNINNIYKSTQVIINKILKNKIFEFYNIFKSGSYSFKSEKILDFKNIILSINDIDLSINNNDNRFSIFNISKLIFSQNNIGMKNDILLSIGSINLLLFDNQIIYKNNTSDRFNNNIFTLIANITNNEIKENVSKIEKYIYNQSCDEEKLSNDICYENYEEYIQGNLLQQPDMKMNLQIFLNGLTFSPFYKDFNTDSINKIINEINPTKNKYTKSTPYNLIASRNVKLELNIVINSFLIDLFYNNDLNKTNWMRFVFSIDKLSLINNFENTEIIIERLQSMFLSDMNIDGADKLLSYFLIRDMNKEDSIFKYYGFIEILNIDYVSIKLNLSNFTYEISINSVEINFCKDSFFAFVKFIEAIQFKTNIILNSFKSHKEEKIEEIVEMIDINSNNDDNITFIDNYCIGDNGFGFEYNEEIINLSDQKKNRKRSSFDLVINEIKKPQYENMIKIHLSSFRFYIFDGKDFAFKNDIHNDNIFESNTEENKLEIVNDYFNNKPKNNKLPIIKARQRIKYRDYDNQLCLFVQDIDFEGIFYKDYEKSYIIKFNIFRIDIDDYVKLSKYTKVISKYEYDNQNPLINIEVEMINSADGEIHLEIKILPINILLDQNTVIFLLDFFDISLNKNEQIDNTRANDDNSDDSLKYYTVINVNKNEKTKIKTDSESKIIFIRRVKINEFFINLSYNSHKLSIRNIKNKNYLELFNLSNITDFRIILKSFEFCGFKKISEFLDVIINYWKEDITKNQILSAILSSVSLIRPFTFILQGFIDIFKQPWIFYKTEKSLKDGFRKGFRNFFISFTSQSLFLGEKLYMIMIKYLNGQTSYLNKNSYYKKFLYYVDKNKKKYEDYYLK